MAKRSITGKWSGDWRGNMAGDKMIQRQKSYRGRGRRNCLNGTIDGLPNVNPHWAVQQKEIIPLEFLLKTKFVFPTLRGSGGFVSTA